MRSRGRGGYGPVKMQRGGKDGCWHLEVHGANPSSTRDTSHVSSSASLPRAPAPGDTVLSLLPGEPTKVKASPITCPPDSKKKGDTHMLQIATINLALFYIFLQLQQMSVRLPGGTLGT